MTFTKLAWAHVAAAFLLAGAALAGTAQDKIVQVTDKGYVPARIEVLVGQKVVFQNVTQKDHTVTSKGPADATEQDKDKTAFDSGAIKPATSWEHAFSKEGTYLYHCKEDKSMTGTIVVSPSK